METDKQIQALMDELLKDSNESIPITPKTCTPPPFSPANIVNDDKQFNQEELKNIKSYRTLREDLARKIYLMMSWELIITGFIVIVIFSIPFLNALKPAIQFRTPPVMTSIAIIAYTVTIYHCLRKMSHDENCKWKYNLIHGLKGFCIIACIFFLTNSSMCTRVITYTEIASDNKVIELIFVLAENIFVKTAILVGFIIKGLFLNKDK